ncbi:Serine/threonine phosphatase 2C containing leucine-rich repeats [Trachipleistophora hominis]|uniref:Serine/threonine phosphatase 2C containing leucine-rich repeats n=1 Tax=Trachipleistophora hominis TaxID=72359 RepID=L7JSV8_TRAHO|nr:Serine/threonine phosphatase 2C containing leucine-rich repeats [Trachipleistophora hominis]
MSREENEQVREETVAQGGVLRTSVCTATGRCRRLLRYIKSSDLSVVVCSLLYNMLLVALLGLFYVYAVCRLGFIIYQVYAREKGKERDERDEEVAQNEPFNITSPLGFDFTISPQDAKYFNPGNFILMTDIVKSTYYMRHYGRGMKNALKKHFRQAERLLRQFRGYLVAVEGDSLVCLFTDFQDAVSFGNELEKFSQKNFITGNENLRLRCLIHQGRLDMVMMPYGVSIVGRTIAEAYVLCDNAKSEVITVSDYVYNRHIKYPGSKVRSSLRIEKICVNDICKYMFSDY